MFKFNLKPTISHRLLENQQKRCANIGPDSTIVQVIIRTDFEALCPLWRNQQVFFIRQVLHFILNPASKLVP